MTAYSASLGLPRAMIWFVAGLLRDNRRKLGTRRNTRILTTFRQAVFILAWMRDGGDIERLGAGFGLSRATAYRRHREALDVLTDQAPNLEEVLAQAVRDQLPYLTLDGTLVPIDRVTETKISVKGHQIDTWYSGKARAFAGNVQALAYPDGIPAWISEVHPGSEHDLTVARAEVLTIAYPYLGDLVLLADGGYVGAPHDVKTPVPQPPTGEPELTADIRIYNRILRGLRFQAERGFALLFAPPAIRASDTDSTADARVSEHFTPRLPRPEETRLAIAGRVRAVQPLWEVLDIDSDTNLNTRAPNGAGDTEVTQRGPKTARRHSYETPWMNDATRYGTPMLTS